MRVVATRIEPDGTVQRRMVDTAQQSDRRLWEDLAARAIGVPVPYRPAPCPALGIAVYHIRVDDYVVLAAEHDLAGPLKDLVTAVMALGGENLEHGVRNTDGPEAYGVAVPAWKAATVVSPCSAIPSQRDCRWRVCTTRSNASA